MRKRTGLRKPYGIRQAEWDSLPEHLKNKIIRKREEQEAKANLLNFADFAKGVVAAEGGFPMDIVSLLAPGGGQGHAQRLTQMRPGGYSGYKEQEFVPEYKGTSPDLYKEMGGTPGSGSGLAGELLAPGAILTAPFMIGQKVKKIASNVPKILDKGNEVLNRVFGAGDPPYSNLGLTDTSRLLKELEAEGQFGDIFIARDRLKKLINSDDPEKRIYNKQIRDYSGFDKWLDEYENKYAKGKKKVTTVSLNDLENFWADQNLDLREAETKAFSNDYNPVPGGTNQKTFIMTYHGKNPPMSLETTNNLNELAKNMHQKPFDELSVNEQEWIERIYHAKYPEDTSAVFDIIPTPGDKLRDQAMITSGREPSVTPASDQGVRFARKEASHFKQPNVVFHLRMDDRLGIGKQKGEKHLNVFELQSDWYARANKGGIWDFEKIDSDIYELQRRNADLNNQIAAMRTPGGRSPAAKELVDEMDDNFVEIGILEDRREKLINKKVEFEELLTSEGRKGIKSATKMPLIHPRQNEKWVELALKRILKKAVDEGYDRITLGSKEIHQELYGGLIKDLAEIKVVREPKNKEFKINRVKIDPISGEPVSTTTTVSGEKFPYHIELFNKKGERIKTNKEGVNHYGEQNIDNIFGKEIANLIREKAKTNKKTVIKDFESVDIGLEHIRVLYENVIPNLIKGKKGSGIFKKMGLKVEKVPVGNNNQLPTQLIRQAQTEGVVAPQWQGVMDENINLLTEHNFNTEYSQVEGRIFSTGEGFGTPDLEDVYFGGSAEFEARLDANRDTLDSFVIEANEDALEAMRQIEIHDRLPVDEDVDIGYRNLLHPETRQAEIQHNIAEIENQNGFVTVLDPENNSPPKFIEGGDVPHESEMFHDEDLYDIAKTGDEIIAQNNEIRTMYEAEWGPEEIATHNRLNNLIKRIELVGHPQVIYSRGVLDVMENSWGSDYRLGEIPYTLGDSPDIERLAEFMPTRQTDFQEIARLENETFDLLPNEAKEDLRQVRSMELILRDNYDIETFYPSLDEEPRFMFSEEVFGAEGQGGGHPIDVPVDRETILEIANDIIAGPFIMSLDNQLGELMLNHGHFRNVMENFNFEVPLMPEPKNLFMVNSIKLTDDKGKLLEKLKPLKEGGKLFYGALPPGILAAQAANQQQSLLE